VSKVITGQPETWDTAGKICQPKTDITTTNIHLPKWSEIRKGKLPIKAGSLIS